MKIFHVTNIINMTIRHIMKLAVSSTLCHVVRYLSTKVPWGYVPEHSKLHGKYHENTKFHWEISFCSHWSRLQNSLSSLRNISHLR